MLPVVQRQLVMFGQDQIDDGQELLATIVIGQLHRDLPYERVLFRSAIRSGCQ